MLEAIRNRMKDREQGFTLIELMVVVLIIAILVAIAIPTFLGARSRAQDKSAASDARNAVTAAKTLFVDSETYTGIDEAGLQKVEPSLDFAAVAGVTAPVKDVMSWLVVDYGGKTGNAVLMITRSDSDKYLCHADVTDKGTGTNAGSHDGSSDTLTALNTIDGCFSS